MTLTEQEMRAVVQFGSGFAVSQIKEYGGMQAIVEIHTQKEVLVRGYGEATNVREAKSAITILLRKEIAEKQAEYVMSVADATSTEITDPNPERRKAIYAMVRMLGGEAVVKMGLARRREAVLVSLTTRTGEWMVSMHEYTRNPDNGREVFFTEEPTVYSSFHPMTEDGLRVGLKGTSEKWECLCSRLPNRCPALSVCRWA